MDDPSDKGDKTYEDWMTEDSVVMGLLWHSMAWNPTLLLRLNFVIILKRFGNLLQNLSRIRVMFLGSMRKFSLVMFGRPLSEYYSTL
jgi:hypothetical protein